MVRESGHVKLMHSTTSPFQINYLQGQSGFLKNKNFEVHMQSSPSSLLFEVGSREQISVHGVEMSRTISPLKDIRSIVQFARLLRKIKPDIVHAHSPKGGLLGLISARLAGVPVRVYHMHGIPVSTAMGFKRILLKLSETLTCGLSNRVFAVSESVRDFALAEGFCLPDKIKILHNGSINGIDSNQKFNPGRFNDDTRKEIRNRYGIPDNAAVIGFIGRLIREKGLVELAKAWKTIREEVPNAYMLIVGPFEPQDPVPPEIEKMLRDDSRVCLPGLDWDTPPLYTAMDVFTLPSYREGFPIVSLEAASMGLPVVASDAPGCVDAVDNGVTGTIVPVRDVAALTAALRLYLNDPGLRLKHGTAGRDRVVRDFRPEDLWQALYNEYIELIHKKGIPYPPSTDNDTGAAVL